MVEARQDGDWVWSVEGVVVVRGGMPVVGVVVTPETVVVITWKTQSTRLPAEDTLRTHLYITLKISLPGVSSYQRIHFVISQ